MFKRHAIALSALLLAGCAQAPAPMPVDRPDAPIGGETDQCGASRYRNLIGQPRSRIPQTPAGATWRVTCTSCPVTMDYSPSRLNIFFNQRTQIVEEVRCG